MASWQHLCVSCLLCVQFCRLLGADQLSNLQQCVCSLVIFIYSNHWESPSYLLSVENEEFEGGGSALKQHIWNAARDTIEAWTGHKQAECSLYGIRIYKVNK